MTGLIEALINDSEAELRKVPKSELHSHAAFACKLDDLERLSGKVVPPPPSQVLTVETESRWCRANLAPVVEDPEGRRGLLDAAFCRAKEDGIVRLSLIFNLVWGQYYSGGVLELVEVIKASHRAHAPDVTFIPSVSLIRQWDPGEQEHLLDEFLEVDYFKAIDVFGDYSARPLKDFRAIYEKAKRRGLKLLAHVSDSGDADETRDAVETLHLDAVQHGTASAGSTEAMKFLADHKIPLNICPTGSVIHGIVESLESHPMRTLYENGVIVTVNTDVRLLTGKSLSEEYLELYRAKTFKPEELEIVRQNGLSQLL